MNMMSRRLGWGLLLGLVLAMPATALAEKDGERDDATARRKAMAEWYNDDFAKGSNGALTQKQTVFSPEYQRFLNEAAKQERERHAVLMPYSGTSNPVIDSLAPFVAAANGNWLNIGPTSANYAINGGTLYVTDAGRVSEILTAPASPGTIYVAFSGGGVWKSTDGGSTWAAKTETLGSLSVGSLAMAPNDADTLYLGLGDPFDGTGIGLVKSTNGGDNWGNVVYLGDSTVIPAIAVARTDPNIVLAGTDAGLYRSTNGGASFSKVTITTGVAGNPYIWTIAWGGGSTFVLSMEADHNNASYQTNGQIWRSTDNGATWTRSSGITDTNGITRLSVAAAPSNRDVMYVEAANNNSYTGSSTDLANFFKSTDNGVTWTGIGKSGTTYKAYTNATTVRVNAILNGQGWYNQMVVVDPINPDIVYFGGALLATKSSDGGTTFSRTTDWLGQYSLPYVHADFHAAHISSSGAIYFGTDGGIFRSTNGGAAFTDTLNRGIASHLIYQVGSSTANRNAVVAGLQDNGTRVREGNTGVFNQIIGGDGFGCNVNRSNANQMLGSLYYSRIYKSTNGGANFSAACSGITECNNSGTAPFLTRIAEWKGDATGNTVFTFSNAKVYKSTNYATSWSALGTTGLPSGLSIRNVGVAASSVNTVGIVANSGRAYITTNGGSGWTQVGSSSSLPGNGLSLSSITFDPVNASIVYIASVAPDAAAKHLWRSTDGGTTWTAIDSSASGFPAGIPVNSLVVDPLASSTLYAATHLGVYTSDNSGTTWTRYGAGMPLVNVTDLYVADNASLIRAATFGRSVWEYAPGGNAAPTANFTFTTNSLTANFLDASTDSDGTIASWAWNFGDSTTSTQQSPSHTYAAGGNYTVTLTVTDNGGATNTISKTVTVAAANQPPTANFSFTTTGLTANFTDGSSDSDGAIASRSWTFGDGATSTATNPSRTYAAAGTYSAMLTVTDNLGATGSITKPVTVVAPTFAVTPSVSGGNGTISPSTVQTVNHGATTTFTLSPAANYHVVTPVGGTCGGTLSGNTYTTNAVTANCTVIASFAIDTYTVTPSSSGNGTISPDTPQSVTSGATKAFVLAPSAGYHVLSVSGSCPAGTLNGNNYTTGAITAHCSVIANFAANPPHHLVVAPVANVPQGDRLGAVTVSIVDVDGNVIAPDSASQVTLTTTACGGSVTLGQATVVNGVATFPAGAGMRFYTLASGKVLTASSGSLGGSTTFDVVAGGQFLFSDSFETCRL